MEFIKKRLLVSDTNPSIVFNAKKCIDCGLCRYICKTANGIDVDKHNDEGLAVCVNCGQCSAICPTGAICERDDVQLVKQAIRTKGKVIVFHTAPAVRVALGEVFGFSAGDNVEKRLVGLLRKLGADYVFDTTFGADMTVMEEATELVKRLKSNTDLPMFTNCCPSWYKYVEMYYPSLIEHITTVRTPVNITSICIKTYFANKLNINPKDIFVVSLTPCTAKKFEILREEMNSASKYNGDGEYPDTDVVLTVKELARWAQSRHLDLKNIDGSSYDSMFSRGSGAGVIFGSTGGVMEATLRTAYHLITGKKPPNKFLNFSEVHTYEQVKEAKVKIGDYRLKVAVIVGLKNTRQILDDLAKRNHKYDLIEVMACPSGCVGGAGQPKNVNKSAPYRRAMGLLNYDEKLNLRYSYKNPDVIKMYNEFFGYPMSDVAKSLLHTHYGDKQQYLNTDNKQQNLIVKNLKRKTGKNNK